jgi:hypothetical protein
MVYKIRTLGTYKYLTYLKFRIVPEKCLDICLINASFIQNETIAVMKEDKTEWGSKEELE